MILIGYRHGLRASELCDLRWSQVELATGRLHVRRAKNGSPSVHPMQGEKGRETAGWDDAKVVQLNGCGQARRRWKGDPTPWHGKPAP